jgi:hypothetical protein
VEATFGVVEGTGVEVGEGVVGGERGFRLGER